MAKVGFLYTEDDYTVGIYNSYFEAPQYDYAAYSSTPTFKPNPKPQSNHFLTANVNYDLSTLLGKEKGSIVFNLYGENLLNEDVWYSKFDRYDVNSIPLRNGPAAYGTLTFKF